MRRKAKLLLFVVAALVAGLTAHAAVVKFLYLDDLVDGSAVIVHGTVVDSWSAWNSSHTTIFTTYRVKAERYIKGNLGSTFEFREPGGVVGDRGMLAPGTPEFRTDDEVLLMLWTDGRSGRYQCYGLEQGVLRVHAENGVKMVNRVIPLRLGDISMAAALGGRTATSRDLNTVLAQLGAANAQVEAARKTAAGQTQEVR